MSLTDQARAVNGQTWRSANQQILADEAEDGSFVPALTRSFALWAKKAEISDAGTALSPNPGISSNTTMSVREHTSVSRHNYSSFTEATDPVPLTWNKLCYLMGYLGK